MFPDELLERNRAHIATRHPQPLPGAGQIPLAILACFDPRLDDLLGPALGLDEGEGFWLRTAGAVVTPANLRSLTVAVYLFGIRQVLVVGHSSCKMADFPTAEFIDAFRRRGVDREAFGSGDLREWVGATPNPRHGVLSSVAAIREAPFLPADLAVAGAVLDDTTCKLELVCRPDDPAPEIPSVSVDEAPPPEAAETPPRVASPAPPAPAAQPPLPDPPAPPAPPAAGAQPLEAVSQAIHGLTKKRGFRDELARLRLSLEQEQNPMRQLMLLRQFVRSGVAESPEIRYAFDELIKDIATSPGTVQDLISSLFGGRRRRSET